MRFISIPAFALLLVLSGCSPSDVNAQTDPYASGGELSFEQAAFDVTFYDLDLRVNPADSSINGSLTAAARIVQPTNHLVLDLDPRLDIESVSLVQSEREQPVPFRREGGKVWIDLLRTRQPQSDVAVRVAYGGRPRIAPQPPWDGGFTWARTPEGEPWIATSCQVIGADVWWPVKDHPSDEPDSMAIHITVPEPLVVASNGHLEGVTSLADGWSTYHWFVSTPINVYNVALNIAPYRMIEDEHVGPNGETYPVIFYVLPSDYEKGVRFMAEIHDHLRFFEETIGPYPFHMDKYGVAQTPHLGMEHQTIIAYGANFDNTAMTGRDWGFDALHHHELAHEWWGNMVTNVDWSDMWIHEGFGTYMQALYMERLEGAEGYRAYMNGMRGGITNQDPVAPRENLDSVEAYNSDIYYKGAWILHTLRYLIGSDSMGDFLRRMAYPEPSTTEYDRESDEGCACRFVSTDDVQVAAEAIHGDKLDWFFDTYLRQGELPRLSRERNGSQLHLRWQVPGDAPFTMPVPVEIDGEVRRIEMADGAATVQIPAGVEPIVDPDRWILREAD